MSAPPDTSDLRWFELEVSPHRLRLAIIPGQPALFGYAPDGDAQGATFVVPTAEGAKEIASLAFRLAGLLDSSDVLASACEHPDHAFAAASMAMPSIHLRVERGGRRFQLYYKRETAPANVREFCESARAIATEWVAGMPQSVLSGGAASALVRPRNTWRDLLAIVVLGIVLLGLWWLKG
jgi:hypothetical protein